MTTSELTEEHRRAINSVLSHTQHYTVTRRLLAITTRAVALEAPLPAVRKWLINLLPETEKLRVLVAQDAAWKASVNRSKEVVRLRSSRKGVERLLEQSVRQMLAIALTPGSSSLVRGGAAAGRNGYSVKETHARAISVLIAKRVVENVMKRGIDTTLFSLALLRAQVGVTPRTARMAIEWSERNGFISKKQRSRSGAFTYALRQLRPVQARAVAEKSDVVECLMAEIAPGAAVTGVDIVYPPADPSELNDSPESLLTDEFRLHRLSRRISRMNELQRTDEDARMNSFGEVIYGVWEPTGVAAGLNPALTAEVAADVLWSVDSIIWQKLFMGESMEKISWGEWAQLLADVLGEPPRSIGVTESTIKNKRLNRAFPGLIDRLNDGERFRDIVRGCELQWEPQAILEERMAEWRETSRTTAERNAAFKLLKDYVEPTLDAVLMTAGKIPAPNADNATKKEWIDAMREAFTSSPPPPEVVPSVRLFLGRRVARKGYSSQGVQLTLDWVLPLP